MCDARAGSRGDEPSDNDSDDGHGHACLFLPRRETAWGHWRLRLRTTLSTTSAGCETEPHRRASSLGSVKHTGCEGIVRLMMMGRRKVVCEREPKCGGRLCTRRRDVRTRGWWVCV